MSAIYLSELDVKHLLTMRTAIDVVEESFRQLGNGRAVNIPRQRAIVPGVVLHTLSAALPYLNMVGWKAYTTTKSGNRFMVGLSNATTGEIVALVDADRLGQMRTGAATGVAAAWLAPPTATELGLFGTGWQAETQLEALANVRPIKTAFVYSRKVERRHSFCDHMSSRLGIEVIPVDRPQEAAEDLPVVITATSSPEPVLDGNWIAEGALVCAVGSNWRGRAELDTGTIRRADNVVCDSVDACRQEAGDFTGAIECGIFNWAQAVNLCDVVNGKAVGRKTRDSVVIFKSVGLGLEDVAVAAAVVELARTKQVGVTLPF